MSQDRLPPPGRESCLVRLRPSSQKGGTIVAEDVTDRATHDRRLCDPDGYRPAFCPNCGESYMTAETLYEIERLKLHRRSLAKKRSVATVSFA